MAQTLDDFVAQDVARGVPEKEARRKWASVFAWANPGQDDVFWTPPTEFANNDLEAAASTVQVDPADFSRRLPGESMAEYGERYASHLKAQREASYRSLEDKYQSGYKNPERRLIESELDATSSNMPTAFVRDAGGSAYGAMTNFQPGASATVDGVSVPAFDVGDGRLRYRLGDVRRAKDAAEDSRWLAGHREMVEGDIERYGHYRTPDTSDELTPEQYQARVDRKRAEANAQQSPRARELRMQRLAARAGVPEALTDDMSEEARLRAMARNAESAQRSEARAIMTRRAQAQRNPLEYINRNDVDELSKMVLAQSVLAGRGDRGPFDVKVAEAAAGGELARVGVMNREVDARIEAMRQEAELARADRQTQSEQFQARMEEMRADRERGRQEFEARLAADSQARQQQNELMLARMAQDAKEAEQRFGIGSMEAQARMAALQSQIEQQRADSVRMMEQMRQQSEAAAADREARERMHTAGLEADIQKTGAIIGKDRDAAELARSDASRARELQFMQGSPGAYDIMTGKSDTPAAIRALKGIASQSEDTWVEDILDPTVYLTLGLADSGFDAGNARRMNDELKRLAKQAELLGIQSQLNDPAYRRDLINRYGFNSGWAGGQGGWLGSLWRSMPEDLR